MNCSLRLAVVLLAAQSLGGPVHAAPAPALAGRTVLRADRPVVADVRLTRPASIRTPLGPSPDVTVSGGGRFAVAALVGTGGAAAGTTFVAGRYPQAGAATFALPLAKYPAIAGGSYEVSKTFPDVTTLPAGSYRVYVVPDGKRMDVTLRLGGLSGTTLVKPSRPARAQVVVPQWRFAGSIYANSAAAQTTLTGAGLGLHALWLDTSTHAGAQYSLCHTSAAPPVDAAESTPGCPFAERTIVTDRLPTSTRDAKLVLQGLAHLPAGRHALGMSYTAQSVVTDARYAVLWLSF